MSVAVEVQVAGALVTLLPERALFWPHMKTLFVADLHLGKTATFLAFGVPVPEGANHADLQRLSEVLARTQAERLIILGDLMHARRGRSDYAFARFSNWRRAHEQLNIMLVRGNHDQKAGDPPADWHITCVDDPMVESPFVLRHIPRESDEGYVLAGHLHPGVQLSGKGRQKLRLPCFWFGNRVGVLPAFSHFTGLSLVKPETTGQTFVVTDQDVIPV